MLIFISLAVIIAIIPLFASARGLVPCGGDGENPCKFTDIFVLIARVTNWLLMFAGVFAVYQMVNNGFWLVITMGNEESITQRKKGLSNAIVGFVLAMLAFVFINTTVNLLLRSRCNVDFKNPLSYLTVCTPNPINNDLNK